MHGIWVELEHIFGPPNISHLYNALLIHIQIYVIKNCSYNSYWDFWHYSKPIELIENLSTVFNVFWICLHASSVSFCFSDDALLSNSNMRIGVGGGGGGEVSVGWGKWSEACCYDQYSNKEETIKA